MASYFESLFNKINRGESTGNENEDAYIRNQIADQRRSKKKKMVGPRVPGDTENLDGPRSYGEMFDDILHGKSTGDRNEDAYLRSQIEHQKDAKFVGPRNIPPIGHHDGPYIGGEHAGYADVNPPLIGNDYTVVDDDTPVMGPPGTRKSYITINTPNKMMASALKRQFGYFH